MNPSYNGTMTSAILNGHSTPITAPNGQNGQTLNPDTYLPLESFNALLGTPLNGAWILTVVDYLIIDNGWIFYWGLSLNAGLYSNCLLGCTVPGAINFNPNATVDDGSCSYDSCTLPQNWNYTNTGANHTFMIPSELTNNGDVIPDGSALGVFFTNDIGELQCAGYTLLNGQINALAVMASDTTSPETDGLQEGAELQWMLWDSEICEAELVDLTYLEDEVVFTINGISFIETLQKSTCQEIDLPEGWYIYSSYIQTQTMDMAEVFETEVDALNIIKNSDGETYLPEWDFNGIGDLQVD